MAGISERPHNIKLLAECTRVTQRNPAHADLIGGERLARDTIPVEIRVQRETGP
jgi:hypothetical protein